MMYRFAIIATIFVLFLSFGFANSTDDLSCSTDSVCLYGSCNTVTLTPQQVQSLWDNFLYKALKPNEIRSGAAALADNKSKSIDENDCYGPEFNNASAKTGIGTELKLGCDKLSADKKNSMLKESCKGDYAVGMQLTDTMRVGRCEGEIALNRNNLCSVFDKSLAYSNAESGWSLAGKSLKGLIPDLIADTGVGGGSQSLSSDFTKKESLPTEDFLAMPKAPEDPTFPSISDIFAGSDVNDVNAKVATRTVQKDQLTNHIQAKDFSAEFQDICSGSDASERCKIYIYSVFNRYYNSYYSGSLLIATAGPAIHGLSKKAIDSIAPKKVKDFFGKMNLINAKSKLGMLRVKGYEDAAVDAATLLRDRGVFGSSTIKDFEKLFNEGSSDKIRKEFEGLIKNLDTPEKKRAFAKYLSTKSSYGTAVKAELSGMSAADAAQMLVAQDKKAVGFGTSIIDTFYEKNPQYNQYFHLDTKASKGYVALSDKAAKEDILLGKINTVYKPTGMTQVPIASPDQLRTWVGGTDKYFIETGGMDVLVTKDNVEELIGKFPGLTNLPVKKAGGFVDITKIDPLHPDPTIHTKLIEEMQGGLQKIGTKTAENATARSDDLLKEMSVRNLTDKKYANLLNWQLYNQKLNWNDNKLRLFTNWVIMPQIFWQVKTSDSSPLKAYFVNEKELSNVLISTGQSSIYDDAYIDFFSNEKFSSGDFFGEAFVKPISKLIGTILPEGDIQKNVLNFAGIKAREDVKDTVYWTFTNNNCPDCVLDEKLNDKGTITVRTWALVDTNNYLVEFPPQEDARVGLSLAAFTHHTNLLFNLNSTNKETNVSDNVNIEDALGKYETCSDKVKSSFFGQIPVIDDWFNANAGRVGVAMGIIDNVGFYALNAMLPGALGLILGGVGTYIVDDKVMAHFDGCVDAEEGYYVHYVHRFEQESQKQGILQGLISKGKEDTKSTPAPEDALDKLNKTVMDLKDKLIDVVQDKDKEFLQISFQTNADVSPKDNAKGKFETNGLFMSWVDSQCHPTEYDEETYTTAISKDSNGNEHVLEMDNKAGTISMDGKVILQSDLVRLREWNKSVRGYEIPQSSTFIPADLGVDYFELLPNGDYRIIDPSTQMCFMDGCAKQTGFSYSTPLQYTGLITELHTKQAGKIYPEGPSFLVNGGVAERQELPASLIVDGNINLVTSDRQHFLGQLQAVVFQKGIMLYRETERDFILWIKILAQINGRDVQRFWGTPTTVTNPETGCDEQAFDLSVLGIQTDVTAKEKGETFDKALKHAGPFQYFETNDNIIMFYSKREASGECKQYMKVIDKKTGKVISDSAIESMSTNSDGSVTFKTEDGKEHKIGFSNEGGVPYLTYNDKKSPLILAQGRNGSFYFDPKSGEWTVANSQMLPFSDDFAQGRLTDGTGKTVPGPNPLFTTDTSIGKKGSWDIPLFEGNEKYLFITMSLFVVLGMIYLTIFKRKEED